MWRTVSPIAADFAPRHHVHMKMRCALSGNHAIFLNEVEPIRVVCSNNGIGGPVDSMNYSDRLFIRKVEQGGSVASRDDVDLPQLKLGPIYECECQPVSSTISLGERPAMTSQKKHGSPGISVLPRSAPPGPTGTSIGIMHLQSPSPVRQSGSITFSGYVLLSDFCTPRYLVSGNPLSRSSQNVVLISSG